MQEQEKPDEWSRLKDVASRAGRDSLARWCRDGLVAS